MNDQTIGFKITWEEKEELKSLAKAGNKKLSDFLRVALLRNPKILKVYQSLALLLLYDGGEFNKEVIKEVNFMIDTFESAKPILNYEQFNLIKELISALSIARKEVEKEGVYIFHLREDLGHEFWLYFLCPDLTEHKI